MKKNVKFGIAAPLPGETVNILLDFVIAGSVKDVKDRIEQYIRAGVDHFVFRDFSPDKKKSLRVLSKEIIPHFRN